MGVGLGFWLALSQAPTPALVRQPVLRLSQIAPPRSPAVPGTRAGTSSGRWGGGCRGQGPWEGQWKREACPFPSASLRAQRLQAPEWPQHRNPGPQGTAGRAGGFPGAWHGGGGGLGGPSSPEHRLVLCIQLAPNPRQVRRPEKRWGEAGVAQASRRHPVGAGRPCPQPGLFRSGPGAREQGDSPTASVSACQAGWPGPGSPALTGSLLSLVSTPPGPRAPAHRALCLALASQETGSSCGCKPSQGSHPLQAAYHKYSLSPTCGGPAGTPPPPGPCAPQCTACPCARRGQAP